MDWLSVGQFQPEDGSYLVLIHRDQGRYYRFVFRDGLLVGAILFGEASFGTAVQKAVEGQTDFSGLLAKKSGREGPGRAFYRIEYRKMEGLYQLLQVG